MNKITYIIFFTLLTLHFSPILYGQQRKIDQEVICISPADTIVNGASAPLEFIMVNHGPDKKYAGDTTFYTLYTLADGKRSVIYNGALISGSDVDSGVGSRYADNYGIQFNRKPLTEPARFQFCVDLFVWGTLPNGDTLRLTHNDPNMRNNTDCTWVTLMPNATSILPGISGNEPSLMMYPNPAKCRTYIVGKWQDLVKIQLFDGTGRRVLQQDFSEYSNGKLELDLGAYTAGWYFVKVQSGARIWTQKLMIQ